MKELEDRWLSVDEIARYLGVTADTIYRWRSNMQIPAHKIGRMWKFKRTEIDDWITSGHADLPKGSRQS